ncbi:conserved hypothetical protein, partial [Ricinus communis]
RAQQFIRFGHARAGAQPLQLHQAWRGRGRQVPETVLAGPAGIHGPRTIQAQPLSIAEDADRLGACMRKVAGAGGVW